MNHWDEIRTAYFVAQSGTVSAAAEALGVHRATIIRHIDVLEKELGEKIFLRHAGGYTPTEAGKDLMRVAKVADDQFHLLSKRVKGKSNTLEGEIIVTAIEAFAHLLLPTIRDFKYENPAIKTHFIATSEKLRLEYGDAHIALRPGPKPEIPDNIVQHFLLYEFGMFASPEYVERNGMLKTEADIPNHRFILKSGKAYTPFEAWLQQHIPQKNIALEGNSPSIFMEAVNVGVGIGFMPILKKKESYPHLIEVFSRREEWHLPLWLLTHKDMHHTEKVQIFLKTLNKYIPFLNA